MVNAHNSHLAVLKKDFPVILVVSLLICHAIISLLYNNLCRMLMKKVYFISLFSVIKVCFKSLQTISVSVR